MKPKWIQIWLTVSSFLLHALAGIAFDPQRKLPTCPPSQHLDISSLECTACDNGLIPNSNGECVCPPRSFLSVNTSSLRTSCVSCPTNEVSSIDGLFCASCPQNATISTSGECKCPAGRILVETVEPMNRLKTFQCVDCPINAYPNANQTACVSCPDPVMTSTVNGSGYICSCPSDYVANPVQFFFACSQV
ncbi:hypothetical protein BKA69DRAFT_283584 [Paraphysoderma sedebokerense]|nr:hypothetical protein BKA69DRAFT_283584 [Paraphysoderma sedebokerense]